MRLLEFESKEILKKYSIDTPNSTLVSSPGQIEISGPVLLKAQIPVGGRGKVGGVLESSVLEDARVKIGHILSTKFRGYMAKKVLVEKKVEVEQEFFMAVTYDTVAKEPVAIFSCEGGVDIEQLAQRKPEKVGRKLFTLRDSLPQYRAREIIAEIGITGKILLQLGNIFSKLARIFVDYDATIAEINPLAVTRSGQLVALDCHLDIDDDALFRHKDIADIGNNKTRFESVKNRSEFERQAAEIDNLDHRGVAGRVIEFDGNIGLIIGGGGASLTAFDAVQAHGGRPANYCEIGGNPSVLKVKELTRHILSKPGVEKIAIIMNVVSNTRVDLIARGIVKGILETGRNPADTVAVFRVPGAWEDEGFEILSKYNIKYCDRTVSINKAAEIAVAKITQHSNRR